MRYEEVVKEICDFLGIENTEENVSADMFDRGLVDSFKFMQLMLFVEERFGVRFENPEIYVQELRTIESVAKKVLEGLK